ncbi:DUF58 domain-containing protein [Frondihabitans cladoniiphilus]|uniref:DUF58 domain-containing protein n=1 Tax=Frondihabitans cladoniiphilus TaxID=715785 RepID=A0ABP8W2H9_9MICO
MTPAQSRDGGGTVPPSDPAQPDPGPRSDATSVVPRWSVTPGIAYGAAAAVLLAGLALVLGRAELALVAAPLFFAVALGYDRRPNRFAPVSVRTVLDPDQDATGVRYRVTIDAPPEVEAVSLMMFAADHSVHRVAVDRRTAAGTDRAPGAPSLSGRIPVAHSGPQEILRLHYSLLAGAGIALSSPDDGPESTRLIPPPRLRIENLPMPLRVVGITGAHGSATPGDGGEFRDVALFAPGDRLRRIDWKVTARRAQLPGDLYVRRSFSTADALVMLVVDDRDELGSDVTSWTGTEGGTPTATSLDLAREAALSLASAYIDAGDRVGFRDLAGTARSVEPGGGTRHLDRLRSTIATAAPTGDPVKSVRTPVVPSSAVVVVVSTFLDDLAATMAITWASTGHRVVAIDVLPQPEVKHATREEQTAFRLVMLERNDRIDGMTAAGVEPVRWQPLPGDPVPAVQLRMLSRPRRRR